MRIATAYSPADNKSCGFIVSEDEMHFGYKFFDGKITLEDCQHIETTRDLYGLNPIPELSALEFEDSQIASQRTRPSWIAMELLRRHCRGPITA